MCFLLQEYADEAADFASIIMLLLFLSSVLTTRASVMKSLDEWQHGDAAFKQQNEPPAGIITPHSVSIVVSVAVAHVAVAYVKTIDTALYFPGANVFKLVIPPSHPNHILFALRISQAIT
jgi:hypothetical protein